MTSPLHVPSNLGSKLGFTTAVYAVVTLRVYMRSSPEFGMEPRATSLPCDQPERAWCRNTAQTYYAIRGLQDKSIEQNPVGRV